MSLPVSTGLEGDLIVLESSHVLDCSRRRYIGKKRKGLMEVSSHWRVRQQRYALVGEVCPHCEAKIFPPRDICPQCGEDARTHFHFSGHGKL
ncbi:MAG: zinc ribbon domain-containing protein, partial [Anaerolineales bacterium]